MAHPMRTRFAKDIVAEFMKPARRSCKVIIFADGMPGMPRREAIMKAFARKGYWFFQPRYRGTWESGGEFLKASPEKDIRAVMHQLARGFKDVYTNKAFRIQKPVIYLIGSSFGGPAVLLNSRDKRVKKVLCISPVADWRAPSKKEPLAWYEGVVRRAFGEAYRFSHKDWKKLGTGKFYNPARDPGAIDGGKVMIIHAKDDEVVQPRSVERLAKSIGARLMWRSRGGHLSSSLILKPAIWKKIHRFFGNIRP